MTWELEKILFTLFIRMCLTKIRCFQSLTKNQHLLYNKNWTASLFRSVDIITRFFPASILLPADGDESESKTKQKRIRTSIVFVRNRPVKQCFTMKKKKDQKWLSYNLNRVWNFRFVNSERSPSSRFKKGGQHIQILNVPGQTECEFSLPVFYPSLSLSVLIQ